MKGEMMKRHRSFGSGVLIVVALLLAAIPASASAKSLLEFTEGSPARTAPNGAPAILVLNLGGGQVGGGCIAYELGEVVTDPEKKVVVKGSGENILEECEDTLTPVPAGHITEETWSNGKLKVAGNMEITRSGPCVYNYTKFAPSGSIAVPGESVTAGVATGKLNKEASSKVKNACAKKQETKFTLGAADEEFEPFGMRLT